MSAHTRGIGLAMASAMLAACSLPEIARFEPLASGAPSQRHERPLFSIAVPTSWQLRDPGEVGSFGAFEEPPPNGRYRVYRTLQVIPVPAASTGAPAQLVERGLAELRQRHARDGFVELEAGAIRLCGRECALLRGRIDGPSAGWLFEVLEFYVPGDEGSLVVAFAIPDGQLAPSRDGFVAIAQSLRTSLGAPKDPAGELRWIDEGRVAVRLPVGWSGDAAAEGAVATFVLGESGTRCEVHAEPVADAEARARLARDHATATAGHWQGLQVLAVERSQLAGRAWLRVVAAEGTAAGTRIVDETIVVGAGSRDRVVFRMAVADYVRLRPQVERSAASLQWR